MNKLLSLIKSIIFIQPGYALYSRPKCPNCNNKFDLEAICLVNSISNPLKIYNNPVIHSCSYCGRDLVVYPTENKERVILEVATDEIINYPENLFIISPSKRKYKSRYRGGIFLF